MVSTFSKVDLSKIDWDEYEDDEHTNKPTPPTGTQPADIHNLLASMPNSDALAQGRDWDDYKVSAMDEADVGKTVDASAGRGDLTKTLLKPAAPAEVENPREGYELLLSYTAVLLGPGTPLLDAQAQTVALGSEALPKEVARCVKTMRAGERARFEMDFTFVHANRPEGVPPHGRVSYEITLHEIRPVETLADGLLRVKTLKKGEGWERPDRHCKVRCRWRGEVADTGFLFADERDYHYVHGDAELPRFWSLLQMRKGEEAEVYVEADAAYGDAGEPSLGVPPNARLKLFVKTLDWVHVEDISCAQDGSVLKTVLGKGQGWERPRERYECEVDVSAELGGGGGGVAERTRLKLGDIGASEAAQLLTAQCGSALMPDFARALDLLLPTMAESEKAEVALGPLRLEVTLHGWRTVELVPNTSEQVLRTTVFEPKDTYDRPNERSECVVSYTVRLADDESAAPVEEGSEVAFVQSCGNMLPCIDAAVREMKAGERCRLDAPPEWAYGAAELPPRSAAVAQEHARARASAVVVELVLHSYVREKDLWEMGARQKWVLQQHLKDQGTSLFKTGDFERAIKRYEKANIAAPCAADIAKEAGPDDGEPLTEAEIKASKAAKASCHVNIATCHLKLGAPADVIASCNKALELDPKHAKALWRRGQARVELADLDEARADLMAAARADPKNREVRTALEHLKQRQAEQKQRQKVAFGGMFST